MSEKAFLVIEGLTRAEVLELESEVGADNVEIKQNERGLQEYGALDPVTATVLISAISAVATTVSWFLAKNRKTSSTYLRVFIKDANNNLKELELHTEEYEEMADKDIADAIGRQINDFMKNTQSI